MAETNDLNAHYRSIQTQPNSVPMLNGTRYALSFNENQQYQIPIEKWNEITQDMTDTPTDKFIQLAQWYVNDHYTWQVKRILNLERYYLGDSNIHYWKSDKKKRADNRIAGGLPRYITDWGIGYQFGNDLTFGYENKDDDTDDGQDLLDQIAAFNNNSDEPYHEKNMGKNIWNTGRSYELLYVPEGTTTPKMAFIDPSQAFVVYDTTVDKKPLFAVRYYAVNVMDEITYNIEVYTDKYIYYFNNEGAEPQADWGNPTSVQEHFFGEVPINEIDGNEERVGKWEPHLDKIDARDKSLSEMANSQEDFSNATLVISGDIEDTKVEHLTDDNGNKLYYDSLTGASDAYSLDEFVFDNDGNEYHNKPVLVNHNHDLKSNIMVLKPSKIYGADGNGGVTVLPTSAQYLTKELNADEWKIYVDQLTQDIHKETNTPDMSDDNFVGNASGVAMAYKLMGSDQERVITETLYKRGIMRRLRLLCNYWNYLSGSNVNFNADDQSTNPANNVTIKFTPNLPKNEQEIISNLVSLYDTGEISSQTFLENASQITGIPAEQESQRKSDEDEENAQQQAQLIQQTYESYTGHGSSSNDDGNNADDGNPDDDSSTDDGGDDS